MVNRIVAAISRRLYELLGYRVEREDVTQDLTPPCFVIEKLGLIQQPLLGDRKKRNHSFDILYYPQSEQEPKAEIREVLDLLLNEMEYISLEDEILLHGIDMRCETVDGVGHFLADYNTIVRRVPAGIDPMEVLEVTSHTKGSKSDG